MVHRLRLLDRSYREQGIDLLLNLGFLLWAEHSGSSSIVIGVPFGFVCIDVHGGDPCSLRSHLGVEDIDELVAQYSQLRSELFRAYDAFL